ncbi:MAG: aldo/keto reductase [Nitrosomonadales bacterium]|nr:aldo/keto reductase [Nitrosomonadales bacterium]
MEQRAFGTQGFTVSALGLGAGHIGDPALDEDRAGALLNRALDLGITLIDTARSYGMSEERIGRHLGRRRSQFAISTKVGYGIPGHADWTYGCILAGIDAALARLRTDYLDIVHLHSCPLETLQRGDAIRALLDARERGKLRVAAYSGENDELQWAIESGHFGGVECSVNLFDQRCLERALPMAQQRGIGVIAKRPLANAPWRFAARPAGNYCEEYWLRWKAMEPDTFGMDWETLALRFAAYAPAVCSAIVGTSSIDHLLKNAIRVEAGALQTGQFESVRKLFRRHGVNWLGQI